MTQPPKSRNDTSLGLMDTLIDTSLNGSKFLNRIIKALSSEFAMTDLGKLHYFLGISVSRTKSGLHLSQEKYADDILQRANMQACKSISLAGALQYLTFTRPDIGYAVQQLCIHMHDPRILHYIKGTTSLGLDIVPGSVHQLTAYYDVKWRCSTSGYYVFLCPNLISWSSKRQPTVSRSSAEAKYRVVAIAIVEAYWLCSLVQELSSLLKSAMVVFYDDVSAVYMSSNPIQHLCTKHIEIDIHFVRVKVALGEAKVFHIPSTRQFADLFTNVLPSPFFTEFRDTLCLREPSASTAGVLE
ncbi:hypothetical protein V2J09_011004 [Rumex salicifolius]